MGVIAALRSSLTNFQFIQSQLVQCQFILDVIKILGLTACVRKDMSQSSGMWEVDPRFIDVFLFPGGEPVSGVHDVLAGQSGCPSPQVLWGDHNHMIGELGDRMQVCTLQPLLKIA
jgi:hypothetical protein